MITDLTAGTGRFSAIPKDALVEIVPSRGVAELLDTIRVRHVSGGLSTIGLKSYEKGREKWQGEMLDYVWFDEEPPSDVYLEGLTRTNVGNKPCWMTFTPLLGVRNVKPKQWERRAPGKTRPRKITERRHRASYPSTRKGDRNFLAPQQWRL